MSTALHQQQQQQQQQHIDAAQTRQTLPVDMLSTVAICLHTSEFYRRLLHCIYIVSQHFLFSLCNAVTDLNNF